MALWPAYNGLPVYNAQKLLECSSYDIKTLTCTLMSPEPKAPLCTSPAPFWSLLGSHRTHTFLSKWNIITRCCSRIIITFNVLYLFEYKMRISSWICGPEMYLHFTFKGLVTVRTLTCDCLIPAVHVCSTHQLWHWHSAVLSFYFEKNETKLHSRVTSS